MTIDTSYAPDTAFVSMEDFTMKEARLHEKGLIALMERQVAANDLKGADATEYALDLLREAMEGAAEDFQPTARDLWEAEEEMKGKAEREDAMLDR